MALYAIGDIHGFSEALRVLLDHVKPTEGDTVVFMGDYVDKGPNVAGTLEMLVEYGKNPNFIFLRGNHDQSLLDACEDESKVSLWACLAGDSPLASYQSGPSEAALKSIPSSHVGFLKSRCLNCYVTKSYIFVHGGIRPDVSPENEEPERLLWMKLSHALPHSSGKTVICGHTSQDSGRIVDLGHTICIDTGITKNKWLTCLNLSDFSFHQISPALAHQSGVLRENIN